MLVPRSSREGYTKGTVRFSLQDYLKGKPRAKNKHLLQILDLQLAQLAMHPASCRGDFADTCKEIKGGGLKLIVSINRIQVLSAFKHSEAARGNLPYTVLLLPAC